MCFNIVYRNGLYDKINDFDEMFFTSINDFRSDSLNTFLKIITEFGDFYIPLMILVCILIFIKNKWIFTLQAGSYALAGVITYFAKITVARTRPFSALIDIPSSYSFPSGHTLTSIVFYIMLVYLLTYRYKKEVRNSLIILASLFALLISFSRPYLGVHFLSDILGGIILSIPILLMLINIINKNFSKKISGK